MTIVVTGGAGFIGSALCRYLVGCAGQTVVNVDKLTYAGNPASLASIASDPRYLFVQADICDRTLIGDVFATFEPSAVIHLAAESHVDRSISGSAAFVETNICGTHVLLEEARAYLATAPDHIRGRFRFIHVSTDEVFGSLGATGAFDEDTAYDPSSPYSASKASADHLARAWWRTYGLPVIVTNCSNNYGPYQYPEKLIPLSILNAIEGRPVPVYGDGSNVRDWLFVDDHVRALDLILAQGIPGRRYMIGGGAERTNLDVVRAICRELDAIRPDGAPHERLITFVADRPGHDFRYAVSACRLERELGWTPRESFKTGLAETVSFYLDNADWWAPLRDGKGRAQAPIRPDRQALLMVAGE